MRVLGIDPGTGRCGFGIVEKHGVAQARGVILLAGYRQSVPVVNVTPLQVKQQLAGYGRAEKKQVIEMVMRIMHINTKINPDDAADALAIGLTAIYQMEHKRLFKEEI